MIKRLIAASTAVLILASFSSVSAQKGKKYLPPSTKSEVKFIDDIELSIAPAAEPVAKMQASKFAAFKPLISSNKEIKNSSVPNLSIENANSLQLKYSILLNTEVEEVQNIALFGAIDEWYGTRYIYGGTTKNGIDCSAFVQTIYTGLYNVDLPRTAREQHKISQQISRTELKQGDLIFFNTIGGVSHVGIYLQNNKFVHSASSGGVMISDLYDDYWMKRYISAGRIEASAFVAAASQP
jgi:lipoprotein Spr